jgi:hypothetical protein
MGNCGERSFNVEELVMEKVIGSHRTSGLITGSWGWGQNMFLNDEIGQGIERANRACIAHFGTLNAQRLGLTVDAFTGGALVVEESIEGSRAVEGDAHQAAQFHVDVL